MTPISPTGLNKVRTTNQDGFTLVEVLSVLLIMGLMAGVVIFNLPEKKVPLHRQGEDMAAHIRHAHQAAMFEGQVLGVILREQGYDIVRYLDPVWLPLETYVFEMTPAPQIVLTQNSGKIDLAAAEKLKVPMIRFDTTGISTPFNLRLEDGQSVFIITGDMAGKLTTEVGS